MIRTFARAHRAACTLGVLVFAAMLVSGCGPAGSALQDAGFNHVGTNEELSTHRVVVEVNPLPGKTSAEMFDTVERIVWQKFEGRINTLCVTLSGSASSGSSSNSASDITCPESVGGRDAAWQEKDRAALQAAYGPRPAGLDDKGIGVGSILAIVFGSIAGVLVLIGAFVIFLVRRSRAQRRRMQANAGYGYPPGPPSSYAPPGQPQPYSPQQYPPNYRP